MIFKPLLAATLDRVEDLKFDDVDYWLASPKLDGVRCLLMNGQAVSRSLKPLPNQFLQTELGHLGVPLDGELVVGDMRHPLCFQHSQSGLMSRDGRPQFTYWVFDDHKVGLPFEERLKVVKAEVTGLHKRVQLVPHRQIRSAEQLLEYEGQLLAGGFEGVMLRHPLGRYKHGRSTLREGHMLKLKRFADAEAIVLDVLELMENQNAPTKDHLGHQVRSSHQAGKAGGGRLGSLLVRDCTTGVEFEIGTGFDEPTRQLGWANRHLWIGQRVTYKHQPVGAKDKPRFPVFKGIRDAVDA